MIERQIALAVIIPTYNGEKYIEQSIYSVLNQPCKDLIVVVVNDGSKDNTQLIVEEIASNDNRVILLNQKNKGVSAARNNALDYCNSIINPRYIAFLDSDDVWVKNFYTEETKRLLLDNNNDLYNFEFFNGDQNLKRGRMNKITVEDDNSIDPLAHSYCSYIYSNDIIRKYNIRFPEGIRVQEDIAFQYIYCSFSNNFKIARRPIFVYRNNIDSVMHTKFNPTDKFFNDIIPAWEYAEKSINKIAKTSNNTKYEKNIAQCRTMIKTYLIEYIKAALEYGIKKEEINNKLNQYPKINYLHDNSIWLSPRYKEFYLEFFERPDKIRIKLRTKYIAASILSKFRSLPFMVKKKYPIDISKLV